MRKAIEGYEGLYEILDDGRVYNCKTGHYSKGSINSYGYRAVSLMKNGERKTGKIHRLLAKAFIPNPNNYSDVNHIDGDKLNNSLDNLEWCSRGMNTEHARTTLGRDFRKKPVVQLSLTGEVIAIWANTSIPSTFVNGNSTLIQACCNGTADTAYGYRWQYAGVSYSDFMKHIQEQVIEDEITRLSEMLETLKNSPTL